MKFFLPALPLLLPFVVRWTEREERKILHEGVPLTGQEMSDAALVGVRHPEKIRLLRVDRIPFPGNFLLRVVGRVVNLASESTVGLTLRYGIFIRSDYWGNRHLVAHECVHTAQYERFGGHRPFLRQYLRECLELGYVNAPLEQEAVRSSAEIS